VKTDIRWRWRGVKKRWVKKGKKHFHWEEGGTTKPRLGTKERKKTVSGRNKPGKRGQNTVCRNFTGEQRVGRRRKKTKFKRYGQRKIGFTLKDVNPFSTGGTHTPKKKRKKN